MVQKQETVCKDKTYAWCDTGYRQGLGLSDVESNRENQFFMTVTQCILTELVCDSHPPEEVNLFQLTTEWHLVILIRYLDLLIKNSLRIPWLVVCSKLWFCTSLSIRKIKAFFPRHVLLLGCWHESLLSSSACHWTDVYEKGVSIYFQGKFKSRVLTRLIFYFRQCLIY